MSFTDCPTIDEEQQAAKWFSDITEETSQGYAYENYPVLKNLHKDGEWDAYNADDGWESGECAERINRYAGQVIFKRGWEMNANSIRVILLRLWKVGKLGLPFDGDEGMFDER